MKISKQSRSVPDWGTLMEGIGAALAAFWFGAAAFWFASFPWAAGALMCIEFMAARRGEISCPLFVDPLRVLSGATMVTDFSGWPRRGEAGASLSLSL